MNQIDNMEKTFKKSRIVYVSTFDINGEEHSRPMTNFNENPYDTLWFPSYTKTRKVEDITKNPKVLVLFPSDTEDTFFEIEGKGKLASQMEVKGRWRWWYLYWHPEKESKYWFTEQGEHPERTIINVEPISAKIISGTKIEKMEEELPREYRNYLKIKRT